MLPSKTVPDGSEPQADLFAEPARKDQRARRRAKITAQVHVRSMNSAEAFDEVAKTVDVSRDGVLFVSRYNCYEKGQLLEVTFPYSNAPGALNYPQPGEVVRVVAQAYGKVHVAVHFLSCKLKAATTGEKKERRAARTTYFAGTLTKEMNTEQKPPVVLLLEPDPLQADGMRILFEGEGYILVAVSTGREALDFLGENVPDVFIAEMEVADISVQELCRNIKGSERLARVPVILTHSSKKPENHAESHKLGAAACIAKPLESGRLQKVVRLLAPPPQSRSAYGADVSNDPALE
ncbi:MAG: response regulator [Candidatus Acidiferrales bacterium]